MKVSFIEVEGILSDLVEAAIRGEDGILLNDDRPVARIISIELQKRRPATER